MQDLKILWQLHKDTREVAKALGISEQKVRKRLQAEYKIIAPSRKEQDERRLRNWLSDITPKIIRTSIWMGRKQDLIPNQADAINHRTGERFMVRVAKENKTGWKFTIGGFPKVERVLLIGLSIDSKILAAYYLPLAILKDKKSILITKGSERYKSYEVPTDFVRSSEVHKKGTND